MRSDSKNFLVKAYFKEWTVHRESTSIVDHKDYNNFPKIDKSGAKETIHIINTIIIVIIVNYRRRRHINHIGGQIKVMKIKTEIFKYNFDIIYL